jgi:hypothetical protein
LLVLPELGLGKLGIRLGLSIRVIYMALIYRVRDIKVKDFSVKDFRVRELRVGEVRVYGLYGLPWQVGRICLI